MPKRKRAEPSGSPSPEITTDRSLSRYKKQCAQRIVAAQRPLVAALRHAASLERQKHSRRKKTAQGGNDLKALARLEAEYTHLKSLDFEKVAEQHLRKTIGKVKSLRENECMPESVGQIEKGNNDPALLNVKGRLFKVDPVRRVVDETIDDLKEIVGAGAGPNGAQVDKRKDGQERVKRNKARIEEDHGRAAVHGEEDSDEFAMLDGLIAAPSSAEDDSEDSLSDGHRPPSEEDVASGDEDVGDDDTSDIESVGSGNGVPDFHSFSDDQASGSESISGTEEEQHEGSESGSDEASIPLLKTKRKPVDSKALADSKFLPTLSHPTYISGSESEASDIEVAPRKNRRGQKARQKIWEQKYKDKAKHIVKQERDRGWDAKRGAVGERGGRNGRGGLLRGRGPEKSGANEQPLGPKKPKRDDAGALHPSWQAAKAAKEKKLDVKPMGKKVVFD